MEQRFAHNLIAASIWLAGLFIFPVGPAVAGVYDDAAAWWHLDYDPNYDSSVTNIALLNEIRDQMDWGTTSTKGASGKHATALQGILGAPLWTNATVVCPAGGQKFGGLCLRFQQETNALGEVAPDAIKIENFRLNDSSAIVTRFLWDGITQSSANPGWIYNNSLDWNNKRGWMFGVRHDGGNRLGMYVGQTALYLGSVSNISTGKWYDAAAVLTDNGTNGPDTVEFYLWPEGGTLQYQKITTEAVTNLVGGSGCVIGSEEFSGSNTPRTGNALKSFKGLIHHLAVWDRVLTYEEVLEAFCFPQPLIQIGVNNGKDTELRAESEVDAEYVKNDPWHTMRRAVTAASPETTLKIPMSALQTNLNYVFHLNTLNTSQTNQKARLQLLVNAIPHPVQLAGRNQDLFWSIPKAQLVAGTNTFTLKYSGGSSSYVTFDWMELGGAWQVGLDNNNAGSDFENEGLVGDHFYITDPNWKHLERAVVQGAESNTVLHFVLSPELVTNALFSYTTRIVQQGNNPNTAPTPPFPFSIGVNGRILYSTNGLPDNTLVNIPFGLDDLRAGDNTINLMFNSTNGWLQFDFHRLNTVPWTEYGPSGLFFSLQ